MSVININSSPEISKKYKNLRILYAVGPESVIEAYHSWSLGQDSPSQVSITFSSQFYEVCRELNAKGFVIAQSEEEELFQDEQFFIKRQRPPLKAKSGFLYHWGQVLSGLNLLGYALKFRVNIIIADSGTTHWFVLSLFKILGINIIPSLHCLLWHKYLPQRLGEKIVLALSKNLFKSQSLGILVASEDIRKQIFQLTGDKNQAICHFFPSYRQTYFSTIDKPQFRTNSNHPFRVLFAGRIEADKGVFDLLEIAATFAKEGRNNIIFDICGSGSKLDILQTKVEALNLTSNFICHGYCDKEKMQKIYSQSHVVIVPTRTEFIEGFNRVVLEAILAGRPVITSSVCPALDYVRDAVIEVPPNDVQSYADSLTEISQNIHLYKQKQQACIDLQTQFYSQSNTWKTAIKSIIQGHRI
ncbi:glycosyltransferase family 4 protein [Calothrix sp. 336/3]|uniref:glycosyltransferase family 4 protein n=1 Tax=Calothrix sp. 336/3 TaxID=1337936 RepID=UPI000624EAC7|nr:glycosyltransferase family 4 protein [Calothrix sp. 336/3]AKG22776.1 glycosyltransferase [Calothrix sp. 336/3]